MTALCLQWIHMNTRIPPRFDSFISLEVPHVVSQDSLRPYPWPRSTSQCSSQPEHEVDDDSKSDQVMTAVDMSDSTRASG